MTDPKLMLAAQAGNSAGGALGAAAAYASAWALSGLSGQPEPKSIADLSDTMEEIVEASRQDLTVLRDEIDAFLSQPDLVVIDF